MNDHCGPVGVLTQHPEDAVSDWWKKRDIRLSRYVKGKGKLDRLEVGALVEFSPEEDGLRGTWRITELEPAGAYPGEFWVTLDPVAPLPPGPLPLMSWTSLPPGGFGYG